MTSDNLLNKGKEKTMKKLLSLLLCLVMIFSLSACGGGGDDGGDAASADKIVKIGRNMANLQTLDV